MGAIKQGGQGLKIRFQSNRLAISNGQVAQLVEQRTENPRVGGSIPPLATILFNDLCRIQVFLKSPCVSNAGLS